MQPVCREDIAALFAGQRRSDAAEARLAVGSVMPDLEVVDWGVLEYLGWIHPAGHLGFVVTWFDDRLAGLVLRRAPRHSRRPHYEMCSWCNHVHRAHGTAMFSATVQGSDGRRSIGNSLCRNLDCSLRIRNLCSDPPTYMAETLHVQDKIDRVRRALHVFFCRLNRLDPP